MLSLRINPFGLVRRNPNFESSSDPSPDYGHESREVVIPVTETASPQPQDRRISEREALKCRQSLSDRA